MELEHVVGFSGRHNKLLSGHPSDPHHAVICMGCNVVIQDLLDAHNQDFLQGHDEDVSVIAASKHLIASGQVGSRRMAIPEAEVIVWDLAQRTDVYHLRGIQKEVLCLSFSPDELFLAGSGKCGSLYIWDMQTGEVVASVGTTGQPTTSLSWGPLKRDENSRRPGYELFATVSHQVTAFHLKYSVGNMVYQIENVPFKMPPGLIRDYRDACVSPCETTLLLCTSVGDVNVYSIQNHLYCSSFPICSGGAWAIERFGPFIFVGGGDGTLKRLCGSNSTWRLDAECSLEGRITSITSTGDDKLLVGTDSGLVYQTDPNTLQIITTIRSETSGLVAVAFRKSCSIRFATLNENGVVRVWDLANYAVLVEARPKRNDEGTCLVFDESEDVLIAGYASGAVRAFHSVKGSWDSGREAWEIAMAHRDGVSSVCETSLFYATGGRQGGVRLWSRSSKTQLFEFSDHISKPVTGLLPDCKLPHILHSCGVDRCVFSYDLKKERRMIQHQLPMSGGSLTSLTQRLDSEFELITASSDGRLLSWDCDVAEPVSQVTVDSKKALAFSCVRVSPQTGHFVAASASDARIRIWEIQRGTLVATSPEIGFVDITSIAWSPDEKQIVCVGLDNCISVWNFYAEDLLEEKESHE